MTENQIEVFNALVDIAKLYVASLKKPSIVKTDIQNTIMDAEEIQSSMGATTEL